EAAEGVAVCPLVDVARRHNVDVRLEHEGGGSVGADLADDAVAFAAGGFGSWKVGVGGELVEVELPGIHLETELVELALEAVLQVRLGVGARHARNADEVDEFGDERALVD